MYTYLQATFKRLHAGISLICTSLCIVDIAVQSKVYRLTIFMTLYLQVTMARNNSLL